MAPLDHHDGDDTVALGMYFTPERYDDAIERLDDAGAGAPAGRLFHVAMEADGLIQAFVVRDSEESFHVFGEVLRPILIELGADPGQPMVSPVRDMIRG